jgi:hypothetical protein
MSKPFAALVLVLALAWTTVLASAQSHPPSVRDIRAEVRASQTTGRRLLVLLIDGRQQAAEHTGDAGFAGRVRARLRAIRHAADVRGTAVP